MKTVQDFVHRRNGFRKTIPNDPNKCQFSVRENTRWSSWHQCYRGVKEIVGGVGFCTQHASQIKTSLGISEVKGVVYFARFQDLGPEIVKVSYSRISERTINIVDTESVIGTTFGLYPGAQKIDKSFLLFDGEAEALAFLITEMRRTIIRHRKLIDELEDEQNKLVSRYKKIK